MTHDSPEGCGASKVNSSYLTYFGSVGTFDNFTDKEVEK